MDNKCNDNVNAIHYNGFCYIVGETDDYLTLITMFPLPGRFSNKKHFDGKTRIKHPNRYVRYIDETMALNA